MERTTVPSSNVVSYSPDEIAALPEEPLGHLAGVSRRVLWRSGVSEAGILAVAAGHQLGAHLHRANHHHLWVLDGRATVGGRAVEAGAYVHVPVGVEHDIDATGTDGCTVFYLYLREGS